ncbi:sulfurtransferase [Rhodococcus sp. IEGM 1408]|uniref:sulfurtransferase n=1 Tax=Rhodococcus sp. IEGM 1408 TaxID=3082220 RepID=UPI002955ABDE|nr:sulfurtransferase [Rhodococcus sp. IEGM 1408]MDV8001686.1 sulfurtransferase [Rhodococcus sp. IEGM 1408]
MTREPAPAPATKVSPLLVTARELISDVANLPTPVILDVRWQLGDTRGREHYYSGHIPGAQYIDLSSDLAGQRNVREGRHPLPSPEDFETSLRRAGVNNDDRVVIYDDLGNTSAARAWWLMRWAGKENVFLLDGGLKAWIAEGEDLAVGPGNPVERGDFTFELDHMRTADIDETEASPARGVLMDVRSPERYAGRTEPMDSRAGHIPGAINLPTASFLDDRGRFLPAERIRQMLADIGVTSGQDTVVYCGSGIHSCHALAAMEVAGLEAGRLFPGSWSQWSADRKRPIAIGESPR